MENSLAKIEKISFHTDSLFCPVIDNEPMVIMNLIIKNIGLSYKSQIEALKQSRFNKWSFTIQLSKEEKPEIQSTLRWIKIEKTGEKTQNYEIQSTLWDTMFSEIGGYEYIVLPIRKLAGWLYSINPSRVNAEIRPKLELYQEECDEVLYQHFFGPISKRKIILVEKSNIDVLLSEIEKELLKIPLYVKFVTLLSDKKRMNKMLKRVDKEALTPQGDLFGKKS